MIRSPQRQLAPDTVGPGIDETTSLRGIADKARHDKAHVSATRAVSHPPEARTRAPAGGPQAGQKVLSLQTVPTREPPPAPVRCVDELGYSLHAEVCCAAHQRKKLGSQGQGGPLLGAPRMQHCAATSPPRHRQRAPCSQPCRAGRAHPEDPLSRWHDPHRHVTPRVFAVTRRPGSPSTAPSHPLPWRARARSQAHGGGPAWRAEDAAPGCVPRSFRTCRSTPIAPQPTTPRRPLRGACPHELGPVMARFPQFDPKVGLIGKVWSRSADGSMGGSGA